MVPWVMGNPMCPEKEKDIKKLASDTNVTEATNACNLLRPKTVIPTHFGSFPVLKGGPSDLQKRASEVEIIEMKPGVTISLEFIRTSQQTYELARLR